MPAAPRFGGHLPECGPAIVALAGTMLDPAATFSRLRPPGGAALVPVDWIGTATGGLPSAMAALAAALEARRNEPVLLLGHSSGGALALLLALERPALVSGLLLTNTGANTRGHGDPDAPKRVAAGLTPALVEAFLARCFVRPIAAELRAELTAYALSCPLDCVVAAMSSQRALDLQPGLPRIRCPTVIVHGTEDKVRTRAHIDVLLQGIRGATCLSTPCGHTPPLEDPATVDRASAELLARAGHPLDPSPAPA